MEQLDIINVTNLEGIKIIKCDLLLKSSWNHSSFSGVVVNGEYTEDGCPKVMTVEQMQTICVASPDIEFVNVNRSNDVIFRYIDKRIGFSVNMNSDTKGKVISSETRKLNSVSLSPAIKIDEEYAKVFRVSMDNIVLPIDKLSDYELIRELVDLTIESGKFNAELIGMGNAREQAHEILKLREFNQRTSEAMKLFK